MQITIYQVVVIKSRIMQVHKNRIKETKSKKDKGDIKISLPAKRSSNK